MEQFVHFLILELEYLKSDCSHACPHQLLPAIIQCRRNLKHRKCFQSIIEEKVDCIGIKFENKSFQEVNEIVDQFVVGRFPEIVRD